MIRRRTFLTTLCTTLLGARGSAYAQRAAKIWRIGYLSPTVPNGPESTWLRGFRDGLQQLGYVEGSDVTITERYADDHLERLPGLASDLVGQRFDIIMSFATPSSLAVKRTTSTIPIVIVAVGDPLGVGLVNTLSKPEGNVTGVALNNVESAEKRVEILKQAAPKVTRLALLANKRNPAFTALHVAATRRVGEARGVSVQVFEIVTPAELPETFKAIARERSNGVLFAPDPMWLAHRERVAQLALQARLPSVGQDVEMALVGCLLSFGADLTEIYRRAAAFVDKIIKGARPGDLPVEQPTKYSLAINLRTANALGLTIPQSLLLRADQLIE